MDSTNIPYQKELRNMTILKTNGTAFRGVEWESSVTLLPNLAPNGG